MFLYMPGAIMSFLAVMATFSAGAILAEETPYLAPTSTDGIGRIWVPVYINDQGPFRMALDTGATSSAITPAVAQRLGVSIPDSNEVLVFGVTGARYFPSVKVDTLKFGNIVERDVILPVVDDAFGGADGFLGTRGWHDRRIEIDFLNNALKIKTSQEQRTPRGFYEIPISLTDDNLVSAKIKVGRTKAIGIFDTGAETTIGNVSLKNTILRSGVSPKDSSVLGVSLESVAGKFLEIPPITIGNFTIDKIQAIFGDMFIFEKWNLQETPALIFGMDVIGSMSSFILDYKTKRLQMRPRTAQEEKIYRMVKPVN